MSTGGPHEGQSSSTAFGKYQLFASLGRGGMADVFLSVARGPLGFNKLAVIKRLRQALAEEASFRNMFLDEARLAARLNHPNIVHTYEVGEHNGIYFIAMEYLEGQPLNKVLKEAIKRKQPLGEDLGARIVADALSGLHFAHELRDYDGSRLSIIHRDVSPHNIFVTYDGHTKLVDFGIAKAALSSTETEVGVLKGKVAYMSPEQATGSPIDCRADIFPMGIVLWEVLTGQRLMQGDSAAQTLHRLVNVPIPRVSEIVQVDPMLDEIVARALEKDRDLRFQSAAEFRDALEAFLARHGQALHQDAVGHRMNELFGKVREDVQRQVQKHMAAITAANSTQELQALNAESLERMQRSGAHVTGQLLRLGVNSSGSGSGIVPTFNVGSDGSLHSTRLGQTGANPAVAPRSWVKSFALLLFAGGFFVLALAGVGFLVLMKRPDAIVALGNGQGAPTATVTPTVTSGPTATATATTPASSTATVAATATLGAPTATAAATGTSASTGGTATAAPTTPPKPQNTARPTSTPATARPTASAAAAQEEPGFLTLQTYPWTKVTANGRSLGPTPLNRVPLPPGTYNLVMENADQGLKKSATVVIKSGELLTKNFDFK